ncbi:putative membrane attack complex component/perforin (MACPF) domain-containing protein [Medicago truncatula]|uniref:MACPF domain protein n=3 Tax=Trifolieae TaxID=163742 RepID=G7LHB4_MEDTR|nr:MACPF domain-containing protein At4g24290 [Medicago truncatula]AET04977.1 MACPF domain protein [Medicago truncatula]RHN42508.1 putative membrane attack complex component/perforin (MACPF) domain-containing protein [Medicago truncatula]
MEVKEGIERVALESLGKGFDLASDFRLRFAKGIRGGGNSNSGSKRLVVLDEQNKRDILIPGVGGATVIKGVSENIRCDKGDRIRFKSDVLEFNQMSELLNQKSAVQGKIPSGYFNALFDMSGDWLRDAADIKYLAFDGYFISLYCLHLTASPLVLQEEVKKSVPAQWDPASLSRFIQTYGTHIVVGMAVGGQDVICVKQKHSSKIPPGDVRRHLEDLGDFLFSDVRSPSSLQRKTADSKHKVPEVFNRVMQSNTTQFTSISETSSKDGLTIICSKRGGDVFKHSHSNWLQTVPSNPEAIIFKFVPISSLLTGIPGSGYLSHAINLYLRYKPSPEDLQYFLEFQIPRQWAPMFCELPLRHQRRKTSSLSLQFCCLGPKLHISSTEVVSEQKPVVGLRLYLEGKKSDRLALHINHLSSLPNKMILSSDASTPSIQSMWRGSDENESSNQFLEPVRWKRFSNVCTAVVKHDPNWLNDCGGVYIVTGAQLIIRGSWPRNVLHLRLLFTHITNCTIRKSEWGAAPEASRKSSFFTNLSTTFSFTQHSIAAAPPKQAPTALNSGIYPNGPPVPVRSSKLLKYVETAEVLRGPHDAPGHWLVTAAKLVTEGGKIGLQVKFALLDYW